MVVTVPRDIADKILRVMNKLKLISSEEFREHQQFYHKAMLKEQLMRASFASENIKIGSFECGLNLIAVAEK